MRKADNDQVVVGGLTRRARSGGGGGGQSLFESMGPGSNMGNGGSIALPSIGPNGQSHSYPSSTNGPPNGSRAPSVHPAYNLAGVSPPTALTAQQQMMLQGCKFNFSLQIQMILS